MKWTKYIFIGLFVSVSIFYSACTNLDEKPYTLLTDDNIKFTDKDIADITGAAYSYLRYTYWSWDGLPDIQEESSDLMMTPLRVGVGWGDYYIAMHQHKFNSSISHYYTIWYNSYTSIGYTNKLLDIPAVRENPTKSAELRTIRALMYYILFDCFRNISLDTTQIHPAGYLPLQVAPQVAYDFIIKELNDAKANLGTKKVFGQPNKYVAEMILAKMYLNHNAWFNDFSNNQYYESALAEVEDITTNGGYTLAPNYKDCFKAKIATCPEIIFALPLDGKYASHNYRVNKNLISDGAKAFGYKGAPWNGSCAIPQFIDTYNAADKRLDDTWAHGQQYDYTSKAALTTNADDQGTVSLVYTKEVHSINNPGAYMLEGFRYVKDEIVAGTDGTYGDDVPFFRLADALFIKAECLLRLGRNQDEAASIITNVRKRSFSDVAKATRTASDLTGGSVYNYGHREWTSKGATNYDPSSFVSTTEGGTDVEFGGLLDDLAWEFVGEHHRRQDLIRFRITGKGMNVYNGKSWFCKDAETDANNIDKNIFPISQTFMDSNPKMIQNPGY
jgi:starch-binding outer membrane protein, SusD/RagB family